MSFGMLDIDGGFSAVTRTMKIVGIEPADYGYSLTLKDYNPALYKYGTLPEYKSNITYIPDGNPKPHVSDKGYVTRDELEKASEQALQEAARKAAEKAAREATEMITHGYRTSNVYTIPDVDMSIESIIEKMDEDARIARDGLGIVEEGILLKIEDTEKAVRAYINITKDRILSRVEDDKNELSSTIRQTQRSILSLVEDENRKVYSAIEQTQKAIVAQVRNDKEALMSTITQTEKSILQHVANEKEGLQSAIQQTAGDLRTEFRNENNGMRTDFQQTWDTIKTSITDTENGLRSAIQQTKEHILAKAEDMKKELKGVLAVQAGAVQALVEGGGARGQMALSLNLPIMIDDKTRQRLIDASTLELVNSVYAKVKGTDYYGIRGDVSGEVVKNLRDIAIKQGVIASQIILGADTINLAGRSIFTSSKTYYLSKDTEKKAKQYAKQEAANRAQEAEKQAKAYADDVEKRAREYAELKGTEAFNEADIVAEERQRELVQAISESIEKGHTIIDGGYLKTSLIDVDRLITKRLQIDSDKNSTQDFEAWFDEYNGLRINNKGKTIFLVDPTGNAFLKNAFLQDGTFTGEIHSGPLHLSPVQPAGRIINLTTALTAKDIYTQWGACLYNVTDKGGNKNIEKFSVFIRSWTEAYYDDLVQRKVGERDFCVYTATVQAFGGSVEQSDFAIYCETTAKRKTDNFWWGTIPDNDFSKANRNFTKNYSLEILTSGKTFRLDDLPSQAPAIKGCVWADSQGFLRIVK